MYNDRKILAIIPARGASKGLPGKNIKELGGKPLIAWTIEQARQSRYLDNCILSSDSDQIISIAGKYGAKAPFVRPKELAADSSLMIDFVLHAIDWFKGNDQTYDIIVVLQPTSPLRAAEDIDKAIEFLFIKNAKAIISVCQTDHHPYWCGTLPENHCMSDFLKPEALNKPRQMLPVFYSLNGAVYVSCAEYLKKKKSFFTEETYAYIMPRERSIDIDTELDFNIAETLIAIKNKNEKIRG